MKADTADKSRARGKYAWRELDRVEPPKRAVADRLSDFNEVSRPYDETTASEQASRCVQCPHPNCVAACPLEIPIPELLALTADAHFREAAELLFNTQSLPEFVANLCGETDVRGGLRAGQAIGSRPHRRHIAVPAGLRLEARGERTASGARHWPAGCRHRLGAVRPDGR